MYLSVANCSRRKHKLPRYQNGHVYLTSHRICYVDDHASKELSVSIALSDVDRSELQVCAPCPRSSAIAIATRPCANNRANRRAFLRLRQRYPCTQNHPREVYQLPPLMDNLCATSNPRLQWQLLGYVRSARFQTQFHPTSIRAAVQRKLRPLLLVKHVESNRQLRRYSKPLSLVPRIAPHSQSI